MGWFKNSDAQKERTAFCSFCRRSYREVGPLVEGPNGVLICTSCVHLCDGILQQEQARRGGKIRAFLVAGATYRFTTETGTWVGIVRARLEHPHEHWVQVDPTSANGAATSEPTWINLLHVHTISEVAAVETSAEGNQASGTPAITDFRIAIKRSSPS
jgi:hypothetical protein